MSHNYNIKGLNVKKSCQSCQAIFQSSLLDDEVHCENCRDDEGVNKDYSYGNTYGNAYDDIVNTSCRTSPVFYD